MITKVTSGIKVSVEVFYQPSHVHPLHSPHFFTYRIAIENESDYAVQLKRRHWFIVESSGTKSEVEGEGVIGKQPVLLPGQVYEYISGCKLETDLGKMYGFYLMERQEDGKIIQVKIPEFSLVAPYRMN